MNCSAAGRGTAWEGGWTACRRGTTTGYYLKSNHGRYAGGSPQDSPNGCHTCERSYCQLPISVQHGRGLSMGECIWRQYTCKSNIGSAQQLWDGIWWEGRAKGG